jgi:hypothetical protein
MRSTNVPPPDQSYWLDEDPDFPYATWKYEVANGDTRAGYWEWSQAGHQCDSDLEGDPEVADKEVPNLVAT